MGSKTRKITLSALFAALSVVMLYIASVWPSGQIGLVAVSSIFVAAAVVEGGIALGIYVFVVSAALGMLITPYKIPPLLYIVFFGYYPVIKSIIERFLNVVLQWVAKLVVLNAALTVIWFFLREVLVNFEESIPGVWLIYPVGSVVFIIYDYGFSKVIWFYISRVSKYMNKG